MKAQEGLIVISIVQRNCTHLKGFVLFPAKIIALQWIKRHNEEALYTYG